MSTAATASTAVTDGGLGWPDPTPGPIGPGPGASGSLTSGLGWPDHDEREEDR